MRITAALTSAALAFALSLTGGILMGQDAVVQPLLSKDLQGTPPGRSP
jgi:hypothetical protein